MANGNGVCRSLGAWTFFYHIIWWSWLNIILKLLANQWKQISLQLDMDIPIRIAFLEIKCISLIQCYENKFSFGNTALCSAEAVELWKWSCSQSHKSPLLLQYQQKVQNT